MKPTQNRYLIIYSYKDDASGSEFCKLKRGDLDNARNSLGTACDKDITKLNYRIYDITNSQIHVPGVRRLSRSLEETEESLVDAGFIPVRTHASEEKPPTWKERREAEHKDVMEALY